MRGSFFHHNRAPDRVKHLNHLPKSFPHQIVHRPVASHKRLQRSSASSSALPIPPPTSSSNGLQAPRYTLLVLQQLFLVLHRVFIEQREEAEQQQGGRATDNI